MDRSPTAPFYEPFPPQTGGRIRGPDPVHIAAYRGAVTGADAYRATRDAVRIDRGTLRLGNRFVPLDRYREFAFLAVGNASVSQGLAVVDALGERVTQGLVLGPIDPPDELPFRHRRLASGWPGDVPAEGAIADTTELVQGLTERDVLLVLVSPGALAFLVRPPSGTSGPAWAEWLRGAHVAGAGGAEIARLARVLGDGLVAGRLAEHTRADIETLVIERGDSGLLVGGGPTVPVRDVERAQVVALLARLGPAGRAPFATASPREELAPAAPRRGVGRPVVVAGPSDALRGAADAVGERKWMPRLAFVARPGRPEALADDFLASTEELLAAHRTALVDAGRSGLVALGTTTFDLPEGVDERPTIAAFLARSRSLLARREATVGAMRTVGAGDAPPPGAVTSAASIATRTLRPIPMRFGITDVGCLLVGLVPVTDPKA